MKKQYFEICAALDEEILGIFEDSLKCNPLLSPEQADTLSDLLYSLTAQPLSKSLRTIDNPVIYNAGEFEAAKQAQDEKLAEIEGLAHDIILSHDVEKARIPEYIYNKAVELAYNLPVVKKNNGDYTNCQLCGASITWEQYAVNTGLCRDCSDQIN